MYLSEAGGGQGRQGGNVARGWGKVMDDSPTGPGTLLPSFSSLSSVLHLTLSEDHQRSPHPPPLLTINVYQESSVATRNPSIDFFLSDSQILRDIERAVERRERSSALMVKIMFCIH